MPHRGHRQTPEHRAAISDAMKRSPAVKARATLGRQQLHLLGVLARRWDALIVADAVSRSLAKRGLVQEGWLGTVYITAAGLRALADRERDDD
jgi:hypothetical protein